VFQSWGNATEDWWPFPTIWDINELSREARSGVIGWPQQSISVSKHEPYEKNRSLRSIINKMLDWFEDPTEPINFGAIYFDEPGRTGKMKIVSLFLDQHILLILIQAFKRVLSLRP
jgi:hypothetical protein